MNPTSERAYLSELQLQGEYARIAIERMNQCLDELGRFRARLLAGENTRPEWVTPVPFFREAHAFLSNAAAMSRILWPPRSKDQTARVRADHLRQALGIKEGHVLEGRTLRDHLEHLEERLDRWSQETKGHGIVDLHIGPLSSIGGGAFGKGDYFRVYDPERQVFIFRGDEFSIQDLANGIAEVNQAAHQRMDSLEEAAGRTAALDEGTNTGG